MFTPVPGGSVEIVYGHYHCQLPPVGYGVNTVTGALEFVGVLSRSPKQKEQKWFKEPLPKDWDARVKREAFRQQSDPAHFDPELEAFRGQEWRRRLCGVWFKNNGRDTYLTGLNYYFLRYVQMDIGSPHYRDYDRRLFYVWEYCVQDPCCGGLVYTDRRRAGKTFKAGAVALEYISRTANAYGGIQSKTGPDAKGVFQKAVIGTFKKLPEYFRPVFDTSKGLTPTTELRFNKTTKKGSRALEDMDKPELDSWIDWRSSELFGYDGAKLHRYIGDEVGKTMDVDVYKRWQVVRFCLEQDGRWVGKALLCTTVEEMENGGKAFKDLWDASDPAVKDANGRTKSGLYRIFFPAYETTFFDEWGNPRVEEAKQYYLNQRDGLKDDPAALSSIIRKNPFTEADMFRVDGETCPWNTEALNNRRDVLASTKGLVQRGNLEWKDGVRDSEVVWVPSATGRWRRTKRWQPAQEELNQVIKNGTAFRPANNHRLGSGADPFDHDVTEDARRSMGASLVKMKKNASNEGHPLKGGYVLLYLARPATSAMFYEDMIKQCFYCGCEILVENNKPGMLRYFRDRGYGGFLMHLKGYKEPGIPSTPANKEAGAEMVGALIEEDIEAIDFIEVVDDWLQFIITETRKFDVGMASLWTEWACWNKFKNRVIEQRRELTDYFTLYEVN